MAPIPFRSPTDVPMVKPHNAGPPEIAVGTAHWPGTGSASSREAAFGQLCCCPDRHRERDLAAVFDDAVAGGQFFLEYQPLVDLHDQRVVGYEALARWRHPELGVLMPGSFIGVAETTGAIAVLGRHLLRQACRAAAGWPDVNGQRCFVSVNVSRRQLLSADFVDDVIRALDDAGLPPSALHLELTEHSAVVTEGYSRHNLQRLTDLGVRLSIDDFGTGYSNLSALIELPLSGLKLDASLLHAPRKATTAKHRAVLRAAVNIGRSLGLVVTAEGVETTSQADLVRDLGCQTGQGWHFGRPVSHLDAGLAAAAG